MNLRETVEEKLEDNVRYDVHREDSDFLLTNLDSISPKQLITLKIILESNSDKIPAFVSSLDKTRLIPTRVLETSINMDSHKPMKDFDFNQYQNELRQQAVSQMNSDYYSSPTELSLAEQLQVAKDLGDIDEINRLIPIIQRELGHQTTNELIDYLNGTIPNLNVPQPGYNDTEANYDNAANYDSYGYRDGLWDGNSLEAHIAQADAKMGRQSTGNRVSTGINPQEYQDRLRQAATKLL